MPNRLVLVVPFALVAALALAGCSGAEPVPTPDPAETTPTADPSVTSAPPVAEPAFVQPADCRRMLPESRIAAFEAQELELLGGPGGKYGLDYLLDDTPEEAAGGITCIWGDEMVPESTITISVAPLSPETRPAIISDLIAQGLNEGGRDGATTFAQLGDEVSSPAVLNVLRDDSWISVIEALGGEAFYEEAETIADEVYRQVYGVAAED